MGLPTKGVTFTGNRRKGDKRASTNISRFLHSAGGEGPAVGVQILPPFVTLVLFRRLLIFLPTICHNL